MSDAQEQRGSSMSPPSAPPLQRAGDQAGSSASSASSFPPAAECPTDLWRDLLRRANGDQGLVGLWLAEMDYAATPLTAVPAGKAAPPLQRTESAQGSGIKAVGGGLAAWGSVPVAPARTAAASKKDVLRSAASAPPRGDADLDSQAAEAGAPRHFFCPVSMQIMRDPVMLATGQTYDRPCIERWLAQGNSSCPATGQALAAPVALVPNVALRNSIEEWAEKHAPWLLDSNRRVKPVPKEEAFAALPPPGTVADPDLAFAIRLQQEELQRITSQRAAALRATPSFGGGVAPPGTVPRSTSGGGGDGGRGRPGQPRAATGCFSLSTLLLLATTAAWVALFIVSLANAGWSLEDLSLNPWAGASQAALMGVGAQDATAVASGGQWWRLFASPFVNAGVIQLLLNMSCLWTFGRYLEASALPHPALSAAAIFLAGAWVGALASANLNAYYVTCGASAGVCALLGAVWADQLLNARKYIHHCWTFVVLLLITAIFIVASLLPLMDPWYQSAALLTGFALGVVLLAAPRARRGRAGRGRWITLQCVCVALVAGGVAAAVVGVVQNAQIGTQSSFLVDGSCVEFGSLWDCLPVGASPNGCWVEGQSDSAKLVCPTGESQKLPSGVTFTSRDTAALTALCYQLCEAGGAAGFPKPPGGSPAPSPSPSVGGFPSPGSSSSSPSPRLPQSGSPASPSDPDNLRI